MGLEFVNNTLINGVDLILAKKQIIREDEIKQMDVEMLVEPGAYKMKITKTIQEKLELPLIEKRKLKMVNGSIKEYDIVGPIEIKFKKGAALLMFWFYRMIIILYRKHPRMPYFSNHNRLSHRRFNTTIAFGKNILIKTGL